MIRIDEKAHIMKMITGDNSPELAACFELANYAPTGMYLLQEGKFIYANPRMEDILGLGRIDTLTGKDIAEFIAFPDRQRVINGMKLLLANKSNGHPDEFDMIRKDGVVVRVGTHFSAARYAGKPAVAGVLQDISEKQRMSGEIEQYIAQIKQSFFKTINAIIAISNIRDPYTVGHEQRVGEISLAIARQLGLDKHTREGIRVAGYLHDIGKIGVPAEILAKPGRLSEAEYTLIKQHPGQGELVLKDINFPWPVTQVIGQHHERLDGSGYPKGLKGDEIALEARVVAVADVVDSMISHRPYRPALGIDKALAELEHGRGIIYEPQVVDALLCLIREKGYDVHGIERQM